jgi:hypothetical protein
MYPIPGQLASHAAACTSSRSSLSPPIRNISKTHSRTRRADAGLQPFGVLLVRRWIATPGSFAAMAVTSLDTYWDWAKLLFFSHLACYVMGYGLARPVADRWAQRRVGRAKCGTRFRFINWS